MSTQRPHLLQLPTVGNVFARTVSSERDRPSLRERHDVREWWSTGRSPLARLGGWLLHELAWYPRRRLPPLGAAARQNWPSAGQMRNRSPRPPTTIATVQPATASLLEIGLSPMTV